MAAELARNDGWLAACRATLAESRGRSTLFDGARFARNQEAAFTAILARWQGAAAAEAGPLFIEPAP